MPSIPSKIVYLLYFKFIFLLIILTVITIPRSLWKHGQAIYFFLRVFYPNHSIYFKLYTNGSTQSVFL